MAAKESSSRYSGVAADESLAADHVAERRVALVIGNGAYHHATTLNNPPCDAQAVAGILGGLGFTVIEGLNLTFNQMHEKLTSFAVSIDDADAALFFFAGHGLQVDGENYLVPVDAELAHEGQLERDTINLQRQLAMMSSRANVSVLLLDCCRDNPFLRSLRRSRPGRTRSIDADNGMAEMDAEGAFIAYATAPGTVAKEGDGKYSPFTTALIQHMATPDISIADMMTDVTDSVLKATDNEQEPWTHSSLRRRFYLNRTTALRQPPAPSPSAGPAHSVASVNRNIQAILGTDPCVGEDAIEPLAAAGPEMLALLLARTDSTPQQVHRLRKLCARLGFDALNPLIEAIRGGSWNVKLAAAPCFSALEENNNASYALYNLLKTQDFDVQRLAIAAAGHLGYSSRIRWEITRLVIYDDLNVERISLDHYSFGKLYSYAIEALGRGFARTGEVSELNHIREFFDVCEREGRGPDARDALAGGLEDLKPIAVDQLVVDWLPRPNGHWAELALGALTRLRPRRVVEPVAACLYDARSEVRVAAGICLGGMSDDAAAQAVARAIRDGVPMDGASWATSALYWRQIDWPNPEQFIELARNNSEVSGQMKVSLGLRDHPEAAEIALQGLTHPDTFIRGASAIALAYAHPSKAGNELRGLVDEASSDLERALIATACVLAGQSKQAKELSETLRRLTFWSKLRPFWRYHILAALRLVGDLRSASLWAELSQDDAPRIEAIVTELAEYAAAKKSN